MRTLKSLNKDLEIAQEKLDAVSFERKDTSFRRKGGYFGTHSADLTNVIVVYKYARTRYLYTYTCIYAENVHLFEKVNEIKAKIHALRERNAKRNFQKKLKEKIKIGKWDRETNPNGQYFSAGVYRVAFDSQGNVLAAIHGGYHDSCPYLIDVKKWEKAVKKTFENLPNYHITLKCDGSCGDLFLREYYEFPNIKVYDVPAPNGNGNNGFVHENIQVI